MTVNQAVRALRKQARKTQQVFATELKMSIASLQNYEQDRTPQPKQLTAFYEAAKQLGRADLAAVFSKELNEALGIESVYWRGSEPSLSQINPDGPEDWYERQALEAVAACIFGGDPYADILPAVISAVALAVERQAVVNLDPESFTRFANESVRRQYVPKIREEVMWETTIPQRRVKKATDLLPSVRQEKRRKK